MLFFQLFGGSGMSFFGHATFRIFFTKMEFFFRKMVDFCCRAFGFHFSHFNTQFCVVRWRLSTPGTPVANSKPPPQSNLKVQPGLARSDVEHWIGGGGSQWRAGTLHAARFCPWNTLGRSVQTEGNEGHKRDTLPMDATTFPL